MADEIQEQEVQNTTTSTSDYDSGGIDSETIEPGTHVAEEKHVQPSASANPSEQDSGDNAPATSRFNSRLSSNLAGILFSRAFRISGLLDTLPAVDLKNLVLLLTFQTPSGYCSATVQQLAHWMHVSEDKAQARMRRLIQFRWQGKRVVDELRQANGTISYSPSFSLRSFAFDYRTSVPPVAPETETPETDSLRDRVLAHSRTTHAQPREKIEREIAAAMGWTYPFESTMQRLARIKAQGGSKESTELSADVPAQSPEHQENDSSRLVRELLAVGLTSRQVENLLDRFPLERIQQQLAWLPHRQAKNPARFLMAAIEGNYEAPRLFGAHRSSDRSSDQPSHALESDGVMPDRADATSSIAEDQN